MKLKTTLLTILFMLSLFSISSASAKTSVTSDIEYLLTFIEKSECIFIRNGSEHDSKDARKHIEQKYNYLKADITSAEEFIEQAASKSSFSGKVYHVKCGEQQLTTRQWLLTALKDYRTAD